MLMGRVQWLNGGVLNFRLRGHWFMSDPLLCTINLGLCTKNRLRLSTMDCLRLIESNQMEISIQRIRALSEDYDKND